MKNKLKLNDFATHLNNNIKSQRGQLIQCNIKQKHNETNNSRALWPLEHFYHTQCHFMDQWNKENLRELKMISYDYPLSIFGTPENVTERLVVKG